MKKKRVCRGKLSIGLDPKFHRNLLKRIMRTLQDMDFDSLQNKYISLAVGLLLVTRESDNPNVEFFSIRHSLFFFVQ